MIFFISFCPSILEKSTPASIFLSRSRKKDNSFDLKVSTILAKEDTGISCQTLSTFPLTYFPTSGYAITGELIDTWPFLFELPVGGINLVRT